MRRWRRSGPAAQIDYDDGKEKEGRSGLLLDGLLDSSTFYIVIIYSYVVGDMTW